MWSWLILLVKPLIIVLKIAGGWTMRKTLLLGSSASTAFPARWGGRWIAGHEVAVIGTVFQTWSFTVFVQFLELWPPILEPDFHLRSKKTLLRRGSWHFKVYWYCHMNILIHTVHVNNDRKLNIELVQDWSRVILIETWMGGAHNLHSW